ncbi:MAG: threonine/serine exporter family protein [Eubacteriales bacterium]
MSEQIGLYLTQGISIIIGTGTFALIFRIRLRMLPFAALGGFLAWLVWRTTTDFLLFNAFTSNLFAALCATAYSEILARILKTPSTIFLTPSILPLVPGATIYSTLVALVDGDQVGFTQYGTLTLQVGVGIAAGIIIASIIGTFFRPLRPTLSKLKKE